MTIFFSSTAVENGVESLLKNLKGCKTKKGWRKEGNMKEYFNCFSKSTGPVFYCKKSPMYNDDE